MSPGVRVFRVVVLCAVASSVGAGARAVEIDWVTVNGPGNACDSQLDGCFGAVDYVYQIGKYEVTNAQYTEFLNAVADSDTYSLYHPDMDSVAGNISRTGRSGNYIYTTKKGRGNKPVTYVSFYDSLRFVNWLQNGQPAGAQDRTTTEDGAYTFTGEESVGGHKRGATIFLPSEDEWYKAAYYYALNDTYNDYPAGSDTQTFCASPDVVASNTANCSGGPRDLTDVGSYTLSLSANRTFDQGGNVWEWNEAVIGSRRGLRGGGYNYGASTLGAAHRGQGDPGGGSFGVGFRVARDSGPEWVAVRGGRNAPDGTGYGAVPYTYLISKFEVTNAQYVELLNAVAATDSNGLYNSRMETGHGGILRRGNSGSYTYISRAGNADEPVNFVGFYDSLRYANWLHNGRPTGAQDSTTTEGGSYTFIADTSLGGRNLDATVFLPSEDEWYKAAYYDASSRAYYDYPARTDVTTGCAAPGSSANTANCDESSVREAGSYTSSTSPYGTFDQGGNVWEWNEAVVGSGRGVRGGSFFEDSADGLAASLRPSEDPFYQEIHIGFRIAAVVSVPEPSGAVLLVSAVLSLACVARARK